MKIIRKDRTTKTVANLRTGDIFMVPDYCSNGVASAVFVWAGMDGVCVRLGEDSIWDYLVDTRRVVLLNFELHVLPG